MKVVLALLCLLILSALCALQDFGPDDMGVGFQSIDMDEQRPGQQPVGGEQRPSSGGGLTPSPNQPFQRPFGNDGGGGDDDDNEFGENFGRRGRFGNRFCVFCPFRRPFCPFFCPFGTRCAWTRRTCYSCPRPYCRPVFFPGRGRPFTATNAPGAETAIAA
jgi:hypothetical protein